MLGWKIEEGIPVPVCGKVVAPKELSELVACGCKSVPPCSRANCSCWSAGISCTLYCKCEAKEHCVNGYKKKTERMRKKNWMSLWKKGNQRTKGSGYWRVIRHSAKCCTSSINQSINSGLLWASQNAGQKDIKVMLNFECNLTFYDLK